MRRTVIAVVFSALVLVVAPAFALDADDLSDVVGYTMIAFTNVDGDFEGADFGKVVQLENRMIFEFNVYSYSYAYRPSVAVFAEHVSAARIRSAGLKDPPADGTTFYKLIIDDEVYDGTRVR